MSSRTPPAKPDAATQQALRLVGKQALTFGVCLIAVLLVSMMPLPFSLAGIAFGVAAIVVGVRALGAIRKAPQASSLQLLIGVGIAMTAFTLVSTIGQALFFPVFYDYQTCRAQAVTDQGADACSAELTSRLQELIPGAAGLLRQG